MLGKRVGSSIAHKPLGPVALGVSCTIAVEGSRSADGLSPAGASGSGAGGGAHATATGAVPLFPSLVAVIVAVPAAGPVTSPLALTVATPAALVAHAIVRPVSMFPLASFRLAVS